MATVLWIGHVETFRVALAVAVTAPVLWFAQRLGARTRMIVLAALAALAFWSSAAWGGATGLADDGRIVADEVVGAALVLFVLRPARAALAAALLVVYVGVDRLKPWPVRLSEDIPGAAGVVLDDLAAAAVVIAAVLAGRALVRRLR